MIDTPPHTPYSPPFSPPMDITFDATFLSDLILNAKAIFTSFTDYVFFMVAVLIALQLLHMIVALLIKPPRRGRKIF